MWTVTKYEAHLLHGRPFFSYQVSTSFTSCKYALTIVDHGCHAGRPTGVVGCHHGHEHPGRHVVPLATRTVVFAQLEPLSLRRAPHSQVGVRHDDGAGEEYKARQAEGVPNVGGVGRVADQGRGGKMNLNDAPWERYGRQEARGEAPGEGDQEQRPFPRQQRGVLQRVKHRDVSLQAYRGQGVHAGGVDGGVAEGHDMTEGVWPFGVVL